MSTLKNNYKQIEKAIKYIDENFKEHPSVEEIAKFDNGYLPCQVATTQNKVNSCVSYFE